MKKWRYEGEGAIEYRKTNKSVQKALMKAAEDWIDTQCKETGACLNKNNSKKAYQLVKNLTSEKQGRSTTIQDKSGKCLTDEQEILSRWTEYFADVRCGFICSFFMMWCASNEATCIAALFASCYIL